jgi:hypothetical protein
LALKLRKKANNISVCQHTVEMDVACADVIIVVLLCAGRLTLRSLAPYLCSPFTCLLLHVRVAVAVAPMDLIILVSEISGHS